jgi:pimeloyl-ACP methyl ester carboxylesterase
MIRNGKWANLAAKGLAILIIFAFSRILSNPQEKTKTENIVKRMSKRCGDLYCHSVQVPLNHLDRNSQVFIEIQVAMYKAKVQPSGKAIVLLPPGPGRSGIDFLSHTGSDLAEIFDNQVDIISFDSRWVGKTNEYVHCIPKSHQASYLNYNIMAGAPMLPQNPSRNQQLILDKATELGSLMCATNAAALLPFVSTANTARDMEFIRKYFNLEKLDIWSFGHGGLLAATYAHIFPDNAGQVIIDSSKNFDVYQGNILELLFY